MLHAIELTESGGEGPLLELRGDLDLLSWRELSAALDRVAGLRRPALVDLSGVTFLDVQSARELAVYSWLYGHYLSFANPSWQVLASVGACGLRDRMQFGSAADQEISPELSEPA